MPSTFLPKNYYCKFTFTLPSSNWNLNILRSNPNNYQEYIAIDVIDSNKKLKKIDDAEIRKESVYQKGNIISIASLSIPEKNS